MTTPGAGQTPGTAEPPAPAGPGAAADPAPAVAATAPAASTGPTATTAAVTGPAAFTTKGHRMLKADALGPMRPPAPRAPYAEQPAPDLARLDMAALRTLRRDAQQEEADLSYLRRMLHGRIDILRAELSRRAAGPAAARPGPTTAGTGEAPVGSGRVPRGRGAAGSPVGPVLDGPVVERLSEILADGPSRVRTSARHVTLGTPLTERVRQLAEDMLSDVELSDLQARTDTELHAAKGQLLRHEQQVSRRRQALHHTVDACSAEITRRYRAGEANIDDLLSDG